MTVLSVQVMGMRRDPRSGRSPDAVVMGMRSPDAAIMGMRSFGVIRYHTKEMWIWPNLSL